MLWGSYSKTLNAEYKARLNKKKNKMEQPIKAEVRDNVLEELKARGYHKYQLEHLDEVIFLTLDAFESYEKEKVVLAIYKDEKHTRDNIAFYKNPRTGENFDEIPEGYRVRYD